MASAPGTPSRPTTTTSWRCCSCCRTSCSATSTSTSIYKTTVWCISRTASIEWSKNCASSSRGSTCHRNSPPCCISWMRRWRRWWGRCRWGGMRFRGCGWVGWRRGGMGAMVVAVMGSRNTGSSICPVAGGISPWIIPNIKESWKGNPPNPGYSVWWRKGTVIRGRTRGQKPAWTELTKGTQNNRNKLGMLDRREGPPECAILSYLGIWRRGRKLWGREWGRKVMWGRGLLFCEDEKNALFIILHLKKV